MKEIYCTVNEASKPKLTIKRSPNADTRTATHKVSLDELRKQSEQHIRDVRVAMKWFASTLMDIGGKHDWTKILNIQEFYDDYKTTQSGFQGDFKQMHWYKDLHLQERHHLPDKCPDDVNLFDVLERIADGVMAGLARSGTIYEESIDPDILVRAYKNTQALLKAQVVVED